jgi:hypothetical protein
VFLFSCIIVHCILDKMFTVVHFALISLYFYMLDHPMGEERRPAIRWGRVYDRRFVSERKTKIRRR